MSRTARNVADACASAEAKAMCRRLTKAQAKSGLMEAVVARRNLQLAYQGVVQNRGAAGVDDITVVGFKDHVKQHWPVIRVKLLAGEYVPQAVRRVDIPKSHVGGRRR